MRPNNTKHFLTGKNLFTAPFTFLYSYFLLLSLFTFSFLLFNSCNTTEPGSNPRITLNFEDASSTEVWLNLHAGVDLPADVKIYKDNKLSRTINLISKDTVIYEDNLLPQKSYTFRASAKLGDIELQSQNVTATTMDTTSNNYTWQLYNFGDFNATGMLSELYDVAIINENNIWAVGEIHTAETDQFDSNRVWVNPYNLVHWDGQEWELKRIGSGYGNPYHTVYAFNENDVWFDGTIQWDGIRYTAHINNFPLEPNGDGWRVNAMWGTSSSDFYIVGNNGNIAHYNGSGWTKIESGTSYGCYDIYSGNGTDIYIAGGDLLYDTGGILLKENTNGIETIEEGKPLGSSNELFNPYFDGIAKTVWVSKTGTIYFGGSWLYKSVHGKTGFENNLRGNYWGGNTSGQYFGFISKIRGVAENQIILVGERNTIRYFNGANWKQLGMPYNTNSKYTWLSVGITNNLIVVVGYAFGNGTVNGGTIMMLKK